MQQEYDLIVIGAGPTGENVAARAVRGGCRAAVVEHDLVGGECSYWACMPSKALLRPPAVLRAARGVGGAREAVTGSLDVGAVLARRDGFTSGWHDDGQVESLAGAGIDLVRGRGRLAGPRRVEVTSSDATVTTLHARHAVAVCVGTVAAIPPIPGLAEARAWTSREATAATSVPRRLAILGGGVVACEMATAYAALGSQVTLVERNSWLLAGVEPFAGRMVAAALAGAGVDVRLRCQAERVERAGGGTVRIALDTGGSVEADEVLAALGRAPATADLGLETVGLEPGGWIEEVDESMRVAGMEGGWLYAAGDVNHRALLTHMGKYQARACGDAIAARARAGGSGRGAGGAEEWGPWGRFSATADRDAVPQVIFTNPEVAAVGLTEAQARDEGVPLRVVSVPIDVAGASLAADGYQGRAQIVIDTDRQVIVGATFVGAGVGELLHSATVALVGQVPLARLWHAVASFPTISEVWLRLLEASGL